LDVLWRACIGYIPSNYENGVLHISDDTFLLLTNHGYQPWFRRGQR